MISLGYFYTENGVGTFVCKKPPERQLQFDPTIVERKTSGQHQALNLPLPYTSRGFPGLHKPTPRDVSIDFVTGHSEAEVFPQNAWRRIVHYTNGKYERVLTRRQAVPGDSKLFVSSNLFHGIFPNGDALLNVTTDQGSERIGSVCCPYKIGANEEVMLSASEGNENDTALFSGPHRTGNHYSQFSDIGENDLQFLARRNSTSPSQYLHTSYFESLQPAESDSQGNYYLYAHLVDSPDEIVIEDAVWRADSEETITSVTSVGDTFRCRSADKGKPECLQQGLFVLSALIPTPAFQTLIRFASTVVRILLTYMDEVTLAPSFRIRSTKYCKASSTALELYAQNYKTILRNPVILTFMIWGLAL